MAMARAALAGPRLRAGALEMRKALGERQGNRAGCGLAAGLGWEGKRPRAGSYQEEV